MGEWGNGLLEIPYYQQFVEFSLKLIVNCQLLIVNY